MKIVEYFQSCIYLLRLCINGAMIEKEVKKFPLKNALWRKLAFIPQ